MLHEYLSSLVYAFLVDKYSLTKLSQVMYDRGDILKLNEDKGWHDDYINKKWHN